MTTVKRVTAALERHGLRSVVSAIERNPMSGEIVLWIYGAGCPVTSVRQAVAICEETVEEATR